ncbi:MAG TPA: hypothetical protein VJZ27_17505, partial [Aggregatilineales bacterium]|nr:hypothetical protein [Aggregatilineales bacterium]
MRKLILFILIAVLVSAGNIFPAAARQTAVIQLNEVLATEDGFLSFQVPSDWYLTVSSEESQTLLLAASDAERASNWQGAGSIIFHAYLDSGDSVQVDALVNKTLKDHALTGITLESESIDIMGLPATRYTGENNSLKTLLIIAEIPESNQHLRFVATADSAQWDDDFVSAVVNTLTVLPQQA